MAEKRRYPRFYFECVRAYLPGKAEPLRVTDLSLQGCFIEMEDPPPPGTVLSFEMELPNIGRIPVRGMVLHQGGLEPKGAGILFLEIEGEFHHVYAKFLKALQFIEEARKIYEKLLASEE
ncbi:PilZ domain-containing protein [Thermosulfurimonas sp. F29]|uniref:PilZ domain-containing protein n=1 Tax=Thermosulfurimonas sp. F29 TaxID=2867247 RepID=UPI001C831A8C|nr:PilZ domain-containing protein [Thermosulfurimonas sp. F29]MBX6422291.1 PilZ domain-containing protein [Thermosulfurimonas sp. F29]